MAADVRIAVFGSSAISVPIFDVVAERYTVVLAVISEHPRVERGRPIENPVQQWAASQSIPVMNGADVPGDVLRQAILEQSVDLVFLCSYGKLLPQDLLDSPRLASINLHPSPLPYYRGAAPIERQIMDGCTVSAVTIIQMNGALDRGDILAQQEFKIASTDYRPDVERSVIGVGIPLTCSVIERLARGDVERRPQVGQGSYARKLKAEDETIDWRRAATQVYNQIRALSPEPCASTSSNGERLRIVRASPLVDLPDSGERPGPPGTLSLLNRRRAAVRCGEGWLELEVVQFPGKKPMSVAELINGRRLSDGMTFSSPTDS
ncbi:MAG TPA: methionyl-tRNA formyltransferase [Candidatus Cryosericum sp.]|nr:methionyl-tRNA formyltransferase [Candidatus Cryosericum sp.]